MSDGNGRPKKEEEPYIVTFDSVVLLTVPWDHYVAAVWFMYSDTIQLAAASYRELSGSAADLRLSLGLYMKNEKDAVTTEWRFTNKDGSEHDHVSAADRALQTFAECYEAEMQRIDIRDKTSIMELIITAVTKAEMGWTDTEA